MTSYSFLITVFSLFMIGLCCLIVKRDMIRLLIGIGIMFNSANLSFVFFSTRILGFVDPLAHTIVIMGIVLEGCVVAVGLTIILNAFRHYGTLDVRQLRRLRW